jgi:phosphoribosylaminoimidazolecarboxamide formyltransferase/IMP cyclohydrolase
MSINVVARVDDFVKVQNILVSVSDKGGLEQFIPELVEINPEIRIFSTGGTYGRINEILGDSGASRLMQVSDYTGQPETQGGLVKTLDFKIYLGLLTETYNDAHQGDLKRTGSVPIDMVVVNLYPFKETISKPDVTVEQARGNIDIGGPCMIRASAKNYIRVASVVDPADYGKVLAVLKANQGSTSLDLRFQLARKAFDHTAVYDRTIADFLVSKAIDDVKTCYQLEKKE